MPRQDRSWLSSDPDEWMRHVLAIHFDPGTGTPYWLERERELGLDVRRDVRRRQDLALFGPMPEDDLARRPLEDFLPRSVLARKSEWVVVETGGTLGNPKTTLYLEDELRAVFVDPFTSVARANGFPEGVGWLFAGPTGPHVIGRAARENARALGAADPFTVDFDPRWAKRLVPGSLGQKRYLEHVVGQAVRVMEKEDVRVLFSTPVALLALAAELEAPAREKVGGVFYGGLPVSPEDYGRLREAFPRAVHLAGFGNTLLGLALQREPSADGHFDYYYPGVRIDVRLVEPGGDREVDDGEVGQVVASRLDETFLIVNLHERDEAVRLPATRTAEPIPLVTPGLRDPRPLSAARSESPGEPVTAVAAGFY